MRLAIVLSSLLLAISSLSQAQSKTLQQEKSQVTDARFHTSSPCSPLENHSFRASNMFTAAGP